MRIFWLTTQSYDRVVFLGDYFDDYDDNASDACCTAMWLRQRMDTTDDIFLLGNHDAAYLFPDVAELYCPGFTKPKAKAIHEILQPLRGAHAPSRVVFDALVENLPRPSRSAFQKSDALASC